MGNKLMGLLCLAITVLAATGLSVATQPLSERSGIDVAVNPLYEPGGLTAA